MWPIVGIMTKGPLQSHHINSSIPLEVIANKIAVVLHM